MKIRKVILATKAKQDLIEIESTRFSIRVQDGVFTVVVPAFDDWNQTQEYDLRPSPATSQFSDEGMTIEFPNEVARSHFYKWLTETFAKAEHGYNTMWP